MIRLGTKYTDSIIGFSGIAVVKSEYLYGCVRVTLENKKGEERHFDEQRLIDSGRKIGGSYHKPVPR